MSDLIKGIKLTGDSKVYDIDYSSLANRPFGVEEEETILSETTIDIEDNNDEYSIEPPFLLIDGDTYDVTINGTTAEVVATSDQYGGEAVILSTDDWTIISIFNSLYEDDYSGIQFRDFIGDATISIVHKYTTKIAKKDLPLEVMYLKGDTIELFEENNITLEEYNDTPIVDNGGGMIAL